MILWQTSLWFKNIELLSIPLLISFHYTNFFPLHLHKDLRTHVYMPCRQVSKIEKGCFTLTVVIPPPPFQYECHSWILRYSKAIRRNIILQLFINNSLASELWSAIYQFQTRMCIFFISKCHKYGFESWYSNWNRVNFD